tara:strand:+ start:1250 stop:1435 length:186 start_codon:yes stop_codon:yes gene_type:complete
LGGEKMIEDNDLEDLSEGKTPSESKPELKVNKDAIAEVVKKYKKIKKYQKSNLFQIKKLNE